jgi:hypothetical protein
MEGRPCDGQGEESYSVGKYKSALKRKELIQERTRVWTIVMKMVTCKEVVYWETVMMSQP